MLWPTAWSKAKRSDMFRAASRVARLDCCRLWRVHWVCQEIAKQLITGRDVRTLRKLQSRCEAEKWRTVSRLDTLMLCRMTFNVTWVCWRMGTHWRGGLKSVLMWVSLLVHGSMSSSDSSSVSSSSSVPHPARSTAIDSLWWLPCESPVAPPACVDPKILCRSPQQSLIFDLWCGQVLVPLVRY